MSTLRFEGQGHCIEMDASITGRLVYSENVQLWHSISFGFEIEPNQLSAALLCKIFANPRADAATHGMGHRPASVAVACVTRYSWCVFRGMPWRCQRRG